MGTTVSTPTLGQDVVFGWFNLVSTAITELQTNIPWINLVFRSPWANYGSYVGGQYRKVDDMVQLRGLIARNAASAFYVADLPVGYRPTKAIMFLASTGEPNSYGRLDIYTDGSIYAASAPANWVNLGNLQFSTRA